MIAFTGDLGCIAKLPARIAVVLDGDETRQFTAIRQPGSEVWIGDWHRPDPKETFDASGRTASVRTGGARTDCRPSHSAKDPDPRAKDAWLASFTFNCYTQPVQKLEVRGEPGVPISYVRRLPKDDDDEESRPCIESKDFLESPVVIMDIWFATDQVLSETVRLQIGSKKSNLKAPGLLVNHPSVMKHVNGRGGTLELKTLLTAFGKQRAEGLSFAPPLFAPNAYESDFKKLSALSDSRQKKLKVILRVQ